MSMSALDPIAAGVGDDPAMGFNKRKMEDRRRQEAEKEAARPPRDRKANS